jgi:hypothetical protein
MMQSYIDKIKMRESVVIFIFFIPSYAFPHLQRHLINLKEREREKKKEREILCVYIKYI